MGSLDSIKCPKCGELIPVSEALSHQIAERTRAQLKAEAVVQEAALAERERQLQAREDLIDHAVRERVQSGRAEMMRDAEKAARAALSTELEDLKRQAEEKDRKLEQAQESELTLRRQKRALEEREQGLELEVARKLDAEREAIERVVAARLEQEHRHRDAESERRVAEVLAAAEARTRILEEREASLDAVVNERLREERTRISQVAQTAARSAMLTEIEDLRRQSEEKDKLLATAQQAELALRHEKRALEERGKTLELEVARKLDVEREKIAEATATRLTSEYRLREAEKDKKLEDALKANQELSRKLQQGSQQMQGEVLELELEAVLRAAFPTDDIAPVPKGSYGADVMQTVIAPTGHRCGTIVWEAKRTKAWSDGWIQKIKDDQRAVKAEIAVIVSEVLPKDCNHFSQVRGVWVCNPHCAVSLATALRLQVKEVALTKLANVSKNERMEVLYSYLSGAEFRQRVETIVESFVEMEKELRDERRAAERRWAKREKLLQRVIASTAGMHGDLQGLLGSCLQSIPALSDERDADGADTLVDAGALAVRGAGADG